MRRCANGAEYFSLRESCQNMKFITSVCAFLLLTFMFSCQEKSMQSNIGDTISFPDTTEYKKSLILRESIPPQAFLKLDTTWTFIKLDTFRLSYSMGDCPDWVNLEDTSQRSNKREEYYLEAANSSNAIPDQMHVSGNTFVIYGKVLRGNGLPLGREFTVPDPPEWKVIRYYGYSVVKPYRIWGPIYKEFNGPGDTLELTLRLTIQ